MEEVTKLKLQEMIPSKLENVPNTEVLSAWRRLNQWYNAAVEENQAIEDYVNAAVFVIDEMQKRNFAINDELPLYIEAIKLKPLKKINEIKLEDLPDTLMVIQDFISVVGSLAKGKDSPNDLDILIRAKLDDIAENSLIQYENIWLPIRNILDAQKEGILHFIHNPQGPHGDNIPLYDLVLRRKGELKRQIVKGASEMPNWMEYLKLSPGGIRIDLGCGESKPEEFFGIDSVDYSGVDMVADLSQGIPFDDCVVSVFRANHFLEHIENKEHIMNEIYRVLQPHGILIATVPSTNTEGAFSHPTHKSFWNKSSFSFWTNVELAEDRPIFEEIFLNVRKIGELEYIDVVLRKPLWKAISPNKKFNPPKPRVAGLTEAFVTDELIEWAKRKGGI